MLALASCGLVPNMRAPARPLIVQTGGRASTPVLIFKNFFGGDPEPETDSEQAAPLGDAERKRLEAEKLQLKAEIAELEASRLSLEASAGKASVAPPPQPPAPAPSPPVAQAAAVGESAAELCVTLERSAQLLGLDAEPMQRLAMGSWTSARRAQQEEIASLKRLLDRAGPLQEAQQLAQSDGASLSEVVRAHSP